MLLKQSAVFLSVDCLDMSSFILVRVVFYENTCKLYILLTCLIVGTLVTVFTTFSYS